MGHRLGSPTCHPHTCVCGGQVDARGLHGLAGKKSTPRHIRHSMVNDILWRAAKKAQVPTCTEPVGLSRIDARRPDGATLVPWARGKPMAWDITVPDTYAQSHVKNTSIKAGTAADGAAPAAATTKVKYTDITNTDVHFSCDRGGRIMEWRCNRTHSGDWKANNTHQWRISRNRISLSTHLNRHSKGQPSGLPEHLSN